MGTWGTSLYANDTTSDVRDRYIKYLERRQLSNQDAYEKTLEDFKDFIGDQDDEPLLWFALAETQWKVGRLMPEVKAKALEWIEKDGGVELWEESKNGSAGWKKTLEKLRVKLESEQPKEKRFRKRIIQFINPWNLNDIYAYRVHIEITGLVNAYGKYLLMQKIGESIDFDSTDIIMRIQVFDRLFDEMPSADDALETIRNYRLLPISHPSDQKRRFKWRLLGRPDPSYGNEPLCRYNPVAMSTRIANCYYNQGYPKDELTYICTAEGPLNKQHERTDGNADAYRYWWQFHGFIEHLLAAWKDIEYDIIGDGTFEYPTREQQMQIKAEIK